MHQTPASDEVETRLLSAVAPHGQGTNGMKMNELHCVLNLRVGEWVEVKSAEEIMATLDCAQTVDGLPFMPEMLQYCGKRFRVFKSAHKMADTFETYQIRRMANAVHLEGLRCDGAAHAGCQAGCLLFWKDCWLRRVSVEQLGRGYDSGAPKPAAPQVQRPKLDELFEATRCTAASGGDRYRCQATEALKATTRVRRRERWDPRFYVKDLTSGNVKPFDFIRFGALAMLNAFLRQWFKVSIPYMRGLAGDKTPTLELNLQPGDLVRVRPKHEIMLTLNKRGLNRGMWFDAEMVVYCGKGPFRVLRRVETIINEKTGAVMKLKNPCIILEGVTCSGNYLDRRMFSPRNEYPFWREIWLERVDASGKSADRIQVGTNPQSAVKTK